MRALAGYSRSCRLPVLGVTIGLLLAGCATPPPASDPEGLADFNQTNDPAEPTNRVLFYVNGVIDTVVLKPLAKGYRYAVPSPVREGVHNVLSNLNTPVILANDMMQGKPRRAGDTLMRFLINSTVGVAGIFDVAGPWGYPQHGTGFATTLALWGAPDGPYLFLLVLGPSSPRDATGFGVDLTLDPFTWNTAGIGIAAIGWTRFGLSAVDQRERVLDPLDQIEKTALDPYATIRSLYRQHRDSEIQDTRDDTRATVPAWFPSPPPATTP